MHILEKRARQIHNHSGSIRVMSLNLAHGMHSYIPFRGRPGIRKVLDGVISLIEELEPDIVAFQEAEGRSVWTGRFHHLAYITQHSDFEYSIMGEHMDRLLFSYGTAIMARTTLTHPGSTKFRLGRPCFPKGFVYGGIHLEDFGDIDIASCHLDPMGRKNRLKQAEIICDVLGRRNRPLILTGDFNCTWQKADSALRMITERLELLPYKPESRMPTHPSTGRRLDWILISGGLKFESYEQIDAGLSDHLPVVAEIGVA